MILHRDFYFVRHGETEHNRSGESKQDHPDLPLNETGRLQAEKIEDIIADLPIKTVCFSPLQRVKETKDIITNKLSAEHHEIEELMECTAKIWGEMCAWGDAIESSPHDPVQEFKLRTRKGVNSALSHEGPVLIVAHGGVHWMLCYLLQVLDHEWMIDNCVPVHFTVGSDGRWRGKKLI
jgi:probable phosphoglycerate mutase